MRMRILLLSTAYNGLTQRADLELTAAGHEVAIAVAIDGGSMVRAVSDHAPDLILCPFLKARIPSEIWRRHRCVIVHPGIKGDRGPSSLDWAILEGETRWGVTALEAAEEMDAGDVWATSTFAMRDASKSSIYRNEVTDAAIDVIMRTVAACADGRSAPEPLDYSRPDTRGRLRPPMKQADRAIDWATDGTERIVRRISSADGHPGVRASMCGGIYHLFGAHPEDTLRGVVGEIIARRHGAVCCATVDGAVWITHLRKASSEGALKLPAEVVLGEAIAGVPASPVVPMHPRAGRTFREIWYEERNAVGYLHFDFHNGAMSTDQCRRLTDAVLAARQRPTKVLALMGGPELWSNGIHLNLIEASDDPAAESWRNINAIDDLVHAVLTTEDRLVVSAIRGNAGAGGVIQALAADRVVARSRVVLNPHYRSMGLYGSEFWTYLLPRRVGEREARRLTDRCMPIGAREAARIGLVDDVIAGEAADFERRLVALCEALAERADHDRLVAEKVRRRREDEARKPLADYREEELARMKATFFDPDASYHRLRADFVRKRAPSRQPAQLTAENIRRARGRSDPITRPPEFLPAAASTGPLPGSA